MDNAAFGDGELDDARPELKRILYVYSKTIERGGDIERVFHDINGNTVGKAEVIA